MAKECLFYKYERTYYCVKAKKDLDKDYVHKYCWTYHYDECAIYKEEGSGSSGCYITTACVDHKGLADDCEIMTNLRLLRDHYVKESCPCEIRDYYTYAPIIVSSINQDIDKNNIWDHLFNTMILPCSDLVKQGKFLQAYNLYKLMSINLHEKYIKNK